MSTTESVLSPARRRVLETVAERQPVTLHDLARELGGHPNSTRQKLDALVEAGLLTSAVTSTGSPGRRPKAYSLSEAGREAIGGTVPLQEENMLGAFATYLFTRENPKAEAAEVGRIWGEERAAQRSDDVDNPTAALVEVLDSMGFEPELTDVPEGEALVLHNCPLQGLAGQPEPGVMCELHRNMINGFLHKLGGTEMNLVPYSHSDGCIVRPSEGNRPAA